MSIEKLFEQAKADKNISALNHLKDAALHLQQYSIAADIKSVLESFNKIAVKVDNEKEFNALMKYYDSFGYVWEHGEKPNDYKCKIIYPCFIPFETEFVAVSGSNIFPDNKWGEYQIIPFSDFAKDKGIKLPLIKSEDGVFLYEGDKLFEVNKKYNSETWYLVDADNGKGFWIVGKEASKWKLSESDGYCSKAFSTKQSALDWIEAQKPKSIKLQLECERHLAIITKRHIDLRVGTVDSNKTVRYSHSDIEAIYKAMQELS